MSNELARLLFLKKKYSMDINRFIISFSVLLFCSCEQLKDVSLPTNDKNESSEDVATEKKVDNKDSLQNPLTLEYFKNIQELSI